jgi:hypothetical protein
VRLSDKDGGTLLTYNVEAQIGGKLAQLGQCLVNGAAKKMVYEITHSTLDANSRRAQRDHMLRIAPMTASGVIGIVVIGLAPKGAKASLTAFSTAAAAPTVPASPAPFAPNLVDS